MKKVLWQTFALLIVASMILVACGTPAPVAEAPAADVRKLFDGNTPPPAGQELTDALAGKYKGKVVTMAGPFTDADAVKFDDSVKAFEAATGIDIQYEGSKEFEASITIRLDGGDAPDIVDFPQPGLLNTAVKKGQAIDLNTVISPDWLKENYSQAWLEMGTMEGPKGPINAGIWARANGK